MGGVGGDIVWHHECVLRDQVREKIRCNHCDALIATLTKDREKMETIVVGRLVFSC